MAKFLVVELTNVMLGEPVTAKETWTTWIVEDEKQLKAYLEKQGLNPWYFDSWLRYRSEICNETLDVYAFRYGYGDPMTFYVLMPLKDLGE